jgi:hypothetical protein
LSGSTAPGLAHLVDALGKATGLGRVIWVFVFAAGVANIAWVVTRRPKPRIRDKEKTERLSGQADVTPPDP